MAISRPFLLAVLGAALLGATFVTVQNARNNASQVAPVGQAQPTEQPAPPVEQPATPGPEQAVAGSLENLESASFSAGLEASGGGQSGTLTVKGAFEEPVEGTVPEFELFIEAGGPGSKLEVGLVSLGERAYLTEGDRAYRVPPEAWSRVIENAKKTGAGRPAVALPMAINPQNWLRDVKQESSEPIDGVETTHVSASLDVSAMVNETLALAKAAGAPGARLPARLQGRLEQSVKRADLDVYFGRDDEVLRRARADVRIALPGERPLNLSAGVELTNVNQPQRIEAPKNVVEGVPDGSAGRVAEGLLRGLSGSRGEGGRSLAVLANQNPDRAARAVKAGRKVVLLFYNPRGLDDRAVRGALREVDATTNAVVLSDDVAAVESYGKLVEDLGVSQTPSVVLIDSKGKARLLEGFIDSDSLAQAVADAR